MREFRFAHSELGTLMCFKGRLQLSNVGNGREKMHLFHGCGCGGRRRNNGVVVKGKRGKGERVREEREGGRESERREGARERARERERKEGRRPFEFNPPPPREIHTTNTHRTWPGFAPFARASGLFAFSPVCVCGYRGGRVGQDKRARGRQDERE